MALLSRKHLRLPCPCPSSSRRAAQRWRGRRACRHPSRRLSSTPSSPPPSPSSRRTVQSPPNDFSLQIQMCPKLCQTIFPSVSYLRELVADLEALFQDVLVGALVLLEDLVDQVAAVDLGAAEARQEGRRACTTANHRYQNAAQRERSFASGCAHRWRPRR